MMRLEYKPLSFSTTMRNPERIAVFVESLLPYEGKLLSNETIKHIVIGWIIKKMIRTDTVNKEYQEFREIYLNSDKSFSIEQAEFIYEYQEKNTKGHKDAGFDKGWPTRFNTYMLLPMEFGFVYYEMNKPIEISETGKLLVKSYQESTEEQTEDLSITKTEDIFLNALAKYQTNNPFRRNLIENAPFVLFLRTVKVLHDNYEWDKSGIYRNEIPFVICWPNDDAISLAKFINDFRFTHGKTSSDEIVYETCLKLLSSDNRTRFKFKQIVKEGVDDIIRKLRVTGVVSLRGNGRLVDINRFEEDRVNYVINNYEKYISYTDAKEYYLYMGTIDNILIETHTVVASDDISSARQRNLVSWSNQMLPSDIVKEFRSLTSINGSQHPVLKYISAPTRFEFLMSVALKKKYPDLDVKPNYPVDDEGMPTSTARGGVGDIEVYGKKVDVLVEVTLMRNKSQSVNEIPGITRHMIEFKDNKTKLAYSLFVAPSIHPDTNYMIGYSKSSSDVDIYPLTIDEFVIRWEGSAEIMDLTHQ